MIIYLLEEVLYVKKDDSDGERIEYRLADGFWADKRKLLQAKKE